MRLASSNKRRGGTMVESAVVYPVTFFIILSMIVGGMGVFRYQEMAALCREGSRYGSTHGAQYRKDAGQSIGTAGAAAGSSPVGTAAPYNVAPWTTMLWYTAHPTEASATYPNQWTDVIYDNSCRTKLAMIDPAGLQFFVGWPPVVNQASSPDNFPGSRVTVCCKFQVFPEGFIWWNPDASLLSVSTSPMPITN